ncbi:AraC family transcriptional regulator [Kiloniella spongiae]|nr:AraC family transcriptional regulator [Kiloniella spongiae]
MSHDILLDIVNRLAPMEGENLTIVPLIKLYRHEESFRRRPYMYGPCICIVVQGRKRMYYGGIGNQDKFNDYNPENYLVNSVSLPIESDAYDLSVEEPFLAIQIDIDQSLASKLVAEMDGDGAERKCSTDTANNLDISLSSPMTPGLNAVVLRLLETLDDPVAAKILSPVIMYELYYEILRGPRGQLLRNCVAQDIYAHKIAPLVHYIENNYNKTIAIETLSALAGMSASSLYTKFKEATTMTPLQFIQNFRLHKARRLILSGTPIGDASYAVGYNSPSQFSREFKRLFNQSPSEIV